VILKGLTVNGLGTTPANGLNFESVGWLRLDDMVVTGFFGNQIVSSGGGSISLHRCTVRGSHIYTSNGIVVTAATGVGKALIANSVIEDAVECVLATTGAVIGVFDSHVGPCYSDAFHVEDTGDLTIERSVGSNSNDGLVAGGGQVGIPPGGVARISNCTFSGNVTGVHISLGAVVYSRLNNTIEGNSSQDVSGSLTQITGK
jgi:hypothetical protein